MMSANLPFFWNILIIAKITRNLSIFSVFSILQYHDQKKKHDGTRRLHENNHPLFWANTS